MGHQSSRTDPEPDATPVPHADNGKPKLKRFAFLHVGLLTGFKKEELDEWLQPYVELKSVTIIRPEEEIQVDDMDFKPEQITKMIADGVKVAQKKIPVFGSLREALEKRDVFGSFTISWESNE
jgi:hypothetical protein